MRPRTDPAAQPAAPVNAHRIGMWDDERRRPLLYAAVYAAAIVASLLLSHAYASGWRPW